VALSILWQHKGDFTVEKSNHKFTQINRFNFINDYRNWEDFSSWITEDPEMKIMFPEKTIGTGASFSWKVSKVQEI
jgi:hypothetical protein